MNRDTIFLARLSGVFFATITLSWFYDLKTIFPIIPITFVIVSLATNIKHRSWLIISIVGILIASLFTSLLLPIPGVKLLDRCLTLIFVAHSANIIASIMARTMSLVTEKISQMPETTYVKKVIATVSLYNLGFYVGTWRWLVDNDSFWVMLIVASIGPALLQLIIVNSTLWLDQKYFQDNVPLGMFTCTLVEWGGCFLIVYMTNQQQPIWQTFGYASGYLFLGHIAPRFVYAYFDRTKTDNV